MKNIQTGCKIFIGLLLIGIFTILPAISLELDMSVDEEIRKKYNSTKLQYDVLPSLPKIDSASQSQNKPQTSTSGVPKTTPAYTTAIPNVTAVNPKDGIKISAGTKFQVRSNQLISDWAKSGSAVSFTSYSPVYKNNITIPSGTKFYGVIEESHRPQKTGNGGLVVIRLTSMSYNGKNFSINGKITKANSKKIFFNNIKGQRQYWKGVAKQIDKGEAFYSKTRKTSSKMADNPILVILSPVPTIVGVAGYSVCTILSPLTALSTTGGNLSIPSGSTFEIKLLDSVYVR